MSRLHLRTRPPVGWYTATGNQNFAGRTFFVQNAGQSYSLEKATNRGNSYRFEAHPGDFFSGDTGLDRIRSELQCSTKESFDTDIWVSFALKVSADPSVLSTSMVVGQFHQTEDAGDVSGYPPFEFNLQPDGLYVYTATVADAVGGSFYPQDQRAGPLSFPLSVYNRLVARCRFNWSSAAELDVWLNGTQVVNAAGISMGMNDAQGPYWKYGLYWRPETAQQNVSAEYMNFEIGGSSLLSRVTSPLPV